MTTTDPAGPADVLRSPVPSRHTTPVQLTWPFAVAVALGLTMFAVGPVIGASSSRLATECGIAIVMAVSLTVVNGFTGQFSIGHSGFMAIGGYLAGSIVYYGSWKIFGDFHFHGGLLSHGGTATFNGGLFGPGDLLFVAAVIAGGVAAAGIGWLVGLPSLRLRGDYLAIVTLGFCEIVKALLWGLPTQYRLPLDRPMLKQSSFFLLVFHTNGPAPLAFLPTYATPFWVWTAVGITLIGTVRLKYSGYGRALLSIREDDIAAQAVGVPITKLKVRAFVFSACFAGVAGALYAMHLGSIDAGELGFQKSFDFVIMVVLGGLGSVTGAALAAVLLTILPEVLRDPPDLLPWGIAVVIPVAVLIWLFAPRPRRPLLTLAALCLLWELVRNVARWTGVDLSSYRVSIYALTLIVMMIVRPQGLFGVHEIWDYFLPAWRSLRKRGAA